MKRLITSLLFLFSSFACVYAQAPQTFNYQAVVRDAGGIIIANTSVNINILIHQGLPTGTAVLDELHTPVTNDFGLVNLQIGSVQPAQFSSIAWGSSTYYIETIINGISAGTQQLMSVPYALHAKTSEDAFSGNYGDLTGAPLNVSDFTNDAGYITTEVDGSVTNEIQILSISNDTVYLTSGGFVKLPVGFSGNYNDLTGAPSNVSAFTNDAGYLNSFTEVDGNVTNELQTLSVVGNDLTISDGNTVALPQTVYAAGTGISITGNTILNTQPDQTVSISGSGATTVTGTYPSFTVTSTDNVNDADDDPANEIQTLSLAGNTLSLSGSNNVSLSGYVDTLWKSNGTKIYNSNNGNVGVGLNTPNARLTVLGNSSNTATEPLFEVKNRAGQTVFIIYEDSVRVYVDDDPAKTSKGAFAVSGRNSAKAFTHNYLLVTPDSSRVYTGDQNKGFGVKNIGTGVKTPYMMMNAINSLIGHEAGKSITSGHNNSFMGYQAGYNTTGGVEIYPGEFEGSNNTFIGYKSGFINTTGLSNSFIGYLSGYSNTSGYSNVFIGTKSGYLTTNGFYNVAIGGYALYNNYSGFYNTANGRNSLYFNTSGNNNTAIGTGSLFSNTTGTYNTANGVEALYMNGTAHYNTGVGYNSLRLNAGGSNNTAIGYNAGYGTNSIVFTQCSFIGAESYPTVSRTNVTMLGYGISNAQCTGNNQVLLGNTTITQIRAQVTGITAYSDKRFKTNVQENVAGLDFILKLKPVTYNENPEMLHKIWGTPDTLLAKINHGDIKSKRFIGFLAQDVETAAKESGFDFPGIDVPRNNKEVYSLRYVDFIMPMVKGMQELNTKNEQLVDVIESQKIVIEQLQKRIEKLESK